MEITFEIDGLPELGDRLDRIASIVSGPIIREALEAGGEIVAAQARANIHSVTGALASDEVVVVRVQQEAGQSYALIGPGWNPESFRRTVRRRGRYANEAPSADQSTNPGVYGKFVEEGHAPPGGGQEKKRARRRGIEIEFGGRDTPPHPWLGPALQQTGDEALEVVAETIEARLGELKL